LKPEISSHVPEATIHKRNYIVHLHEKISAASPIIRDMAQPTEVTLYCPSNVPSQAGLAIKISGGVPECQERRVVVYGAHYAKQTNHHPVCVVAEVRLSQFRLYDAGSSVTKYGIINSARTRISCI